MAGYTRKQLDAHRAANNLTPTTFAAALLRGLGIRETPGALQAIVGWERAEGGHWNNSAKFNPLNTTQSMPGYRTFQSVGQGSAPIGIYNSWQQGVDATVKTLRNGRYGGILKALQAGDPASVASAIGQTPWGTSGGLVQRSIMGTPAPKVPAPTPAAAPARGKVTVTNGTPPRLMPGGDKLDTQGAVTAALLDPRKGMSLGSRIIENVQSGKYTTSTPASITPGKVGKYGVTPAKATVPRAGAAPAASTSAKGTANFEGKTVAAWIKPALVYARGHGWKGTVNSGFRTDAEQTRIYNSGVRPAAVPRSLGGGGSNHEGANFPAGAVDVSDAQTLSRILANSPYAKKLQWAGAKDPVHFSHPHNGSY